MHSLQLNLIEKQIEFKYEKKLNIYNEINMP